MGFSDVLLLFCSLSANPELERVHPLFLEERRKNELLIDFSKTSKPLNAWYGWASSIDRYIPLITIEYNDSECHLIAIAHEIGHHVDDKSMYSALERRLSLPDAANFRRGLEILNAREEYLQQIKLRETARDACSFQRYSLNSFNSLDCLLLEGSDKQFARAKQYAQRIRNQVYRNGDVNVEFTPPPLPSLPFLDSVEETYVSFRNSFSSFLPTPIQIDIPRTHDDLPYEQFAAATDSLVHDHFGDITWNRLRFTLNKELLDGFSEYEYKGVRIFIDHVARYKADPRYVEYWCSRGLSSEVDNGCDAYENSK